MKLTEKEQENQFVKYGRLIAKRLRNIFKMTKKNSEHTHVHIVCVEYC